jgi:metal-dependent hydrolase (beta-lactamase superfamily II)
MKIKFYGTSHGVVEKNRAGQCIFLEVNGSGYFFDMGKSGIECLVNDEFDVNKVKAVFFTHLDSDHYLGIMRFVELATWYFKKMKYKLFFPEERGYTFVKSYVDTMMAGCSFPEDRIEHEIFSEGKIYEDENIKVSATRTKHLGEPGKSYGFLIEAEGKRVYITGDLQYTVSDTLSDFPEVARGKLDMLIPECAHFSVNALISELESCEAAKIAVVHVFPQTKYDEMRNEANRLKGELLCPIDGDEYVI